MSTEPQRSFKYQIDHARDRLDAARSKQASLLEGAQRAEIKALDLPPRDELILQGLESFLRGEIPIVKARIKEFVVQQRTQMASTNYYGHGALSLSTALGLDRAVDAIMRINKVQEDRVKARFGKRIGLMHKDADKIEDELILGEASAAMKLVDAFTKKTF